MPADEDQAQEQGPGVEEALLPPPPDLQPPPNVQTDANGRNETEEKDKEANVDSKKDAEEDKGDGDDRRLRRKESRRSRSRSKDRRRRSKSRSRSRDRRRDRRSSRSRSRDRRRRRSSSRDRRRSRSRDNRRRSRSRDRKRRSRSPRRRDRSPLTKPVPPHSYSPVGGYVPRPRALSAGPPAAPAPVANAYGAMPVTGSAFTAPTSAFQAPIPSDPVALARMLQEQQLRAQQMILQQQLMSAAGANNAKTLKEQRAARRVYVGNLVPQMVTDDQLKAIFNSALTAAFPGSNVPGMEPVVGIQRNPEHKFAFIECRTPEMATAALQLGGQVTLHGRAMSVERPQDFVDPSKQAAAAQMAQLALAQWQQPGGLPSPAGLPGPPGLPPPP